MSRLQDDMTILVADLMQAEEQLAQIRNICDEMRSDGDSMALIAEIDAVLDNSKKG